VDERRWPGEPKEEAIVRNESIDLIVQSALGASFGAVESALALILLRTTKIHRN
jgi:hypothetical protein